MSIYPNHRSNANQRVDADHLPQLPRVHPFPGYAKTKVPGDNHSLCGDNAGVDECLRR